MKTKAKFTLMAFVAIASVSCTVNKKNNNKVDESLPQDVAAYADVKGQWYIENIVFNDSDYVRPDEAVPGIRQFFIFEDSTYFIQTNCNTFSGAYTINGDSIILGDGAMTEMACDNMATEDALRKILPGIATVYVQNDSIVRLNSRNLSEYIVLRKATEQASKKLLK